MLFKIKTYDLAQNIICQVLVSVYAIAFVMSHYLASFYFENNSCFSNVFSNLATVVK